MEVSQYIAELRYQGALLADAASRAGLDAAVPACGGLAGQGPAAAYRLHPQVGRPADPDLECATLIPAPSPLAFWARRQAHETAIYRADAESAESAAGRGA